MAQERESYGARTELVRTWNVAQRSPSNLPFSPDDAGNTARFEPESVALAKVETPSVLSAAEPGCECQGDVGLPNRCVRANIDGCGHKILEPHSSWRGACFYAAEVVHRISYPPTYRKQFAR